jgi:flagellar hook-associated protein 2
MSTISFPGLASGLDTQSLIDASTAASRQTRVKPDQTRVTQLESTNTALEELSTKLETLRTNLKAFATLYGGGVSKTGTSSKESVVSATATSAASNGSYSVTVNELASNHTYSFDTTYTSTDSPIQSSLTGAEAAPDRTVTFAVGTGSEAETVSVEIPDGSYTIQQFADAFNNSSAKAHASVVNTGTTASPAYKLVISSMYEGTEKGMIARTALGSSLTNLTGYAENAAKDASVSIVGIGTITRSSNSISDIIPGVSLSLNALGTSTVKISEDSASTTTKIQDFVDAFNEVVTYVSDNNAVTRQESGTEVTNNFAALASTRIDDTALQAVRDAFASAVASGGSSVRILADLGLATQRDGTIKFDTAKFQESLSAESASVGAILNSLADKAAVTGGTIDQYTRFNGLLGLTVSGNKTTISDLNARISDAEKDIQRQADSLKARYARLESLMGKLQNQQSSLTSALAGLK